ncbi:DUF4166 domain-containing protein [Crystallibacter degradans]|uniref:DUF4166 domain-containing protein n=1 Tax=Crystallibacter degradans TaxID=2726743 RepID=UPI001473374F|nr:DUF4166 domain-containing protein [Arthrobacter sp. SF27]NMR31853.1 DUF4166 domain-containing protein [Arthrobacter sp. SF27]
MTSIFMKALGDDFQRLHPMLQRRFGVSVDAGYACIGSGAFAEVRRGAWWTNPFLRFGAFRNILFPDSGTNVPFTIENYPYIDGLGRETVTFVRTLQMGPRRKRRFDATMIYSSEQDQIIDYLGTHQHLATGLDLKVLPDGSLHLTSGAQRFYEGSLGFTFPAAFTGTAELHETYDEIRQVFTVRMHVHNPRFGFLFGYRGDFTCEFPSVTPASIPSHLKPVREESRQ